MRSVVLHYFTDSLLLGKMANKIAKIKMANAFAHIPEVSQVVLYSVANNWSSTARLRRVLKDKVKSRTLFVPFFQDEPSEKSFLHSVYNIVLANQLIVMSIFIIIMSRRFTSDDIIFVRGRKVALAVLFVSYCRHITFSFELHNYEFGHSRIKDFFCKRLMDRAKKIVTISEYTKSNWVRYGVDEKKIIVFPSGVDVELFDSVTGSKDLLRQQIDITTRQHFLVGHIGSLYRNRGIEAILEAASLDPSIGYVFVGGHPRDSIFYQEFLKKQYGVLENVYFLGYVPNDKIPAYIKSMDAVVAPYSIKHENIRHMSPLKLFEYMVSNVPVVVTDIPAIRQLVTDKEVSFCQPDNGESLYQSLKYIKEHQTAMTFKMETARKKAIIYDWKNRSAVIYDQIR